MPVRDRCPVTQRRRVAWRAVNLREKLRDVVYSVYERRLRAKVAASEPPRHVGVMLDGNRRWAKLRGHDTQTGHRAGAGPRAG